MTSKILAALTSNAALFEAALEKYLAKADPDYGVLYDAMRYAALGGGKRIRPFLTLEFCRLYGGADRAAMPFACAVEMVHSYSLIHDDLPCMDNDDYRRGKPTVHRRFGEGCAMLAGDALLTLAFETAASNNCVSPGTALAAVSLLAKNAGADGMVGGQQLDLIGESKPFDYETLTKMNSLKTGKLIKTACLLGCLAAGRADTSDAEYYADRVGLAFQIEDDLLDDENEDEKTTFLTFLSREGARRKAEELTLEACGALENTEGSEILRTLALYLAARNQ